MGNVSLKALEEAKETALRWKKRVENVREKGEEVVGTVVQTAEIGSTAFVFGYARGRYGETTVANVPIDAGAAVLCHLGGFFGIAGKYSEHLHNVGDGALAVFAAVQGAAMGAKKRAQSGDKTAAASLGNFVKSGDALPAVGGTGTPVGMAEINEAVRRATEAAAGVR